MAMIFFGNCYINPKHISCVGVKEESICGRICGEKRWYEVFILCDGQKIAKSYRTRSEADLVVERIVTQLNQLDGEEDGKTY